MSGPLMPKNMSQEQGQSLDPVTDVLVRIGRKGVKLWAANGRLHYRAAKGLLTHEEIEVLRCHKDQIVFMLEGATTIGLTEPRVASHLDPEPIPLSFSQEAHWHRRKLYCQQVPRTVASATRIVGDVDAHLFRESLAEVVRRHSILRTRIVMRNSTPMQQVSESVDFKFNMQDLSPLTLPTRESEVKRLINELILEPIDVSKGPLWEARLLRLQNEEHVLIVVMEHTISDMRSMQILSRDIFLSYMQLSHGSRADLPAIPVQFTEYAEWQRRACNSASGRSSYWTTRLSGCRRVRFPDDCDALEGAPRGWDRVRVEITFQQRTSLLAWSHLRKTTLSMMVFTAYVALVLRWCCVSETAVHYVIDGRTSEKVKDTMGYFARQLPIRVEIDKADSFVSLLERITTEYCKAYEQADFYCSDAQIPAPDYLSNSSFNWISQDASNQTMADAVMCVPIPFDTPILETVEVDAEPDVLLFDSGREVSGAIYFPRNRFSCAKMQQFSSNFSLFIDALLKRPDESIYDIDFL